VNNYLLSTTAVTVLMVILVVAFLLLARRILRVAIKAAFALTLVFALLLTAGVGWWRGWFSPGSKVPAPARPNNRATSNTRPTR